MANCKDKIIVLGSNADYVRSIAIELSEILDMYYLDFESYMEYTTNMTKGMIIDSYGEARYLEEQTMKFNGLNNYTNTIIAVNGNISQDSIQEKLAKSSYLIGIDIDWDNIIQLDSKVKVKDNIRLIKEYIGGLNK